MQKREGSKCVRRHGFAGCVSDVEHQLFELAEARKRSEVRIRRPNVEASELNERAKPFEFDLFARYLEHSQLARPAEPADGVEPPAQNLEVLEVLDARQVNAFEYPPEQDLEIR